MARDAGAPLLSYLQNARTLADQISILKSLKNEIVGHVQKKATWVAEGALEPVVGILQMTRPTSRRHKRPSQDSGLHSLDEEDNVRLQALQLLASFASGGLPFVDPIIASGALPAILANMSPEHNALAVAAGAVKALVAITEAASKSLDDSMTQIQTIAEAVFSAQHVRALSQLSALPPACKSFSWQPPIASVATLVVHLCKKEKHALALAESDVLDLLATELATFAVADGFVIPGADILGRRDGRAEYIPEPAPRSSHMAIILEALTTLVGDSRYRVSRLLYSPAILAVFPSVPCEPSGGLSSPWQSLEAAGCDVGPQALNAMDYLLPAIPCPQGRGPSSRQTTSPAKSPKRRESPHPHPRSVAGKVGQGFQAGETPSLEQSSDTEDDEQESPLVPWLITLVRTRNSLERLMAADLLASVYKFGEGKRNLREASIALLVIPVLVSKLQKNSTPDLEALKGTSHIWRIRERTPAIIARLITDREVLQKAAEASGAVKVFAKLLKESYEPVTLNRTAKRSITALDTDMDAGEGAAARRLGPSEDSSLLAHRIKVRGAVLKGISALAASKEEYRKALASDHDVIPYIVQSLSTTPIKPSPPKDRNRPEEQQDGPTPDPTTTGYGRNPASVIIAACHATRVLSRSISILRTSLVDHCVYLPIFRFLKHPNIDVQIAASAAICNLVSEISPTKETLGDKGVMTVLADLAHSHNAALRLNAMWALKHFINGSSSVVKKRCLEKLESGWLVRLVCDDMEDDPQWMSGNDLGGGGETTSAGAEEQGVDTDDDVEMHPIDSGTRGWFGKQFPRDAQGNIAPWAAQAEAKKAALRETEFSPHRRGRGDELAIQEQGLDFIRNFIGTNSSGIASEMPNESTEMIDFLLTELGPDRLFDILSRKLQVKILHGSSRRAGTTTGEARIMYPQSRIVVAVVYILVHIAASVPRHRQLVIAQPSLLKLLSNHFSSWDKDVRVALCHLVANLTWQDDEKDMRPCGQRTLELRKLGYMAKLGSLENDLDLDVRERAKTALWQMQQVTREF